MEKRKIKKPKMKEGKPKKEQQKKLNGNLELGCFQASS
jgi:hypothetical protein